MADGRGSGTIELEVKDFGPIVEAKVDLRPFTVFVGPSNTGKSYLAILIYALHRFFGGDGPGEWLGLRRYGALSNIQPNDLSSEDEKELVDWATVTFKDVDGLSKVTHFVPPRRIIDEVRSGYKQQADRLVEEILRCFGAGERANLIRKGASPGAQIGLRGRGPRGASRLECMLTMRARSTNLCAVIPDHVSVRRGEYNDLPFLSFRRYTADFLDNIYKSNEEVGENYRIIFRRFVRKLIELTSMEVAAPLRPPAYYLPADRTGVMHAHAAVVSAVIRNASMTGLRHAAPAPVLSGVLSDFLDRLIQLDRPERPQPGRLRGRAVGMRDRGTGIEETVLDGAVRTIWGEHMNYPSFLYRPKGWKRDLPLMNTSSMVSELTPVVLYLRDVVKRGDLFIVEEPESHLHPAKQVEFTRQLAKLVQAGVRVLITTHSEWILEELANIVQRSGLSEDDRKALPNGEVALRPDQVGAWLFEPKKRPKGSVVKEIPLDEDGTYPTGFDDIALALHNDWAAIGNRVEDTS